MFNFTRKEKTDPVDTLIDDVIKQMADSTDTSTEDYEQMASVLGKLTEIQNKKKSSERSVSPDTIAVVTANLVGILMVIHHERFSVVTSKAVGFIMKAK